MIPLSRTKTRKHVLDSKDELVILLEILRNFMFVKQSHVNIYSGGENHTKVYLE